MRVSKEPEVRKQEIIDTAMKVFSEKGYEATAMKDIAKAMNVVSGLCYHYFPNKQVLYETAVKQYAKSCSVRFAEIFRQTGLPLADCLDQLAQAGLQARENGTFAYEGFFHGKGNEMFHRQLDMEVIRALLPVAAAYLEACRDRGEIRVTDSRATALFILNGQMGIVNDTDIPPETQMELLKELITKTLT